MKSGGMKILIIKTVRRLTTAKYFILSVLITIGVCYYTDEPV